MAGRPESTVTECSRQKREVPMLKPGERNLTAKLLVLVFPIGLGVTSAAFAGSPDVEQRLAGFDAWMAQVMKDWNAPGIGVGVVVKDKLVFAKGYGYRDYGKKLPFTPKTVVPIASNTKLFTATAMGFLVEEGKLEWDKPIRQFVPSVEFYNDELNSQVTIRDMLSHRTGITRHSTGSRSRSSPT
jgi:CubicO group peptidase (beta-lactamase class C family)